MACLYLNSFVTKQVKSRMIPPEVVEQFKARIDDTEHDIKEIIQLEQTERQVASGLITAHRSRLTGYV